ncbi:MAG: alpha,alpha-trehalase TreF [Candidatus Cyclobacteriaceae bacterium M2_1C_046]
MKSFKIKPALISNSLNLNFSNFRFTHTVLPLLLLLVSCSTTTEVAEIEPEVSPEEKFYNYYESDLFKKVQLAAIFPDSKTFVDAIPDTTYEAILQLYSTEKNNTDFDLKAFVKKHYEIPGVISTGFETDTTDSMKEHILNLWPVLTRRPDENKPHSSLIPLPNAYIVPGGRFREIYYWDSYFTLEGLMRSDQKEMAKNMTDNFAFLVDSLGFIPNGNRAYYLGRSQPPFFSLMVDALAKDDRDKFISYHDHLIAEYEFWMDGEHKITHEYPFVDRVVLMPDSSVLNRYWDKYTIPRPESYKEDHELVNRHNLPEEETYRHLRAGAESGWDYSSRWFKDHQNLHTIHTTDIIPVDLNSLLYHLELKIAQGYNWKGELELADLYLNKATKRKAAINKYLWDEQEKFFVDYDFIEKKPTGVLSLAGVYPLYFQIASKAQAKPVAQRLEREFLKPGGFVTTNNYTGEQWDAPNGWPPLQWLTVNALYNYGYNELGNEAAQRWVDRNKEVFQATGKMMEKYNVVNIDLLAGGGEYPLQDGFGWTNGVALSFIKILEEKEQIENAH